MTDDEFKELAHKIEETWKMVTAPYIVLIAAVILMLFLFFFGCSPAAAGGFLVIENNLFECSVEGCPTITFAEPGAIIYGNVFEHTAEIQPVGVRKLVLVGVQILLIVCFIALLFLGGKYSIPWFSSPWLWILIIPACCLLAIWIMELISLLQVSTIP